MENKDCFVAVEFVDDENVRGYCYWYLCPYFDAEEGDKVVAPLGRHNGLQEGIIRKVLFADEFDAPYPVHLIKKIRTLIKNGGQGNVQDSE